MEKNIITTINDIGIVEVPNDRASFVKVGSIYQELLDYIPLQPGKAYVQVPVQINYVWETE
jgi:hypothetical protein